MTAAWFDPDGVEWYPVPDAMLDFPRAARGVFRAIFHLSGRRFVEWESEEDLNRQVLACFSGDDPIIICVSDRELARFLGRSHRSVPKGLRYLEETGWICRSCLDGQRWIRLTMPGLPAGAQP
jgi:hypothetical protein